MDPATNWLAQLEEPEVPDTTKEPEPPAAPAPVVPPSGEILTPPAAPVKDLAQDTRDQQMDDLRTLIREQSRKISQLETKLQTPSTPPPAAPKAKSFNPFDEEDESTPPPPAAPVEPPKKSIMEELHDGLAHIVETKGSIFELQLELMGEQSAYKDVGDVCSQANFDFVISNAARRYSTDKGISLEQAMLEIEYTIWSKPNPYKYMYEVVKSVHPKYKTPAAPTPAVPKVAGTPPDSPPTIANAGGGGGDPGTGWTAAKIDAMPEDDLHKVPRDVYEKWMAGELK